MSVAQGAVNVGCECLPRWLLHGYCTVHNTTIQYCYPIADALSSFARHKISNCGKRPLLKIRLFERGPVPASKKQMMRDDTNSERRVAADGGVYADACRMWLASELHDAEVASMAGYVADAGGAVAAAPLRHPLSCWTSMCGSVAACSLGTDCCLWVSE